MSLNRFFNSLFILIGLIGAVFFVLGCEDIGDGSDDGLGGPMSITPVDHGTIYEAEDRADDHDCEVSRKHSGYTGTGYINYGDKGAWIEFDDIEVDLAGEYTFAFRYANGRSSGRSSVVEVNGKAVGTVPFGGTGGWTSWDNDEIVVTLRQGTNAVRVEAETSSGGPNLDHMVVTASDMCPGDPDKTEPGKCGCGVPEGACDGAIITASGENAKYGEVKENAFDRDAKTKWLTFNDSAWIQYDFAGDAKKVITEYIITSANDHAERDPRDWKLLGSNDGVHFETLDERNVQSFSSRFQKRTFAVDSPGSFEMYRLDISSNLSPSRANSTQLAEIALIEGDIAATKKCAEADEHQTAELSCPTGQRIIDIDFASYGLPTGSCDTGFHVATCHTLTSQAAVERACLDEPSCTVDATNRVFGDPCVGTFKRLVIAYTCGKDGTVDLCPDDPSKIEPGKCGCGVPEGTCNCKESEGCYEIVPSGTSDDSTLIQGALKNLKKGDTIRLKGDFVIGHTIYLPSDMFWILDGTLTLGDDAELDKAGLVAEGIDSRRLTGITEQPGGATGIDMSGGAYYGNAENNAKKGVRFINFIEVTDSNFHDMTIENASDDNFTLGPKSAYNECRNLVSRDAGVDEGMSGNGLTDRGEYNKWYDCIAEDCTSDGWTPKSRHSEFHRCIGRRNMGPGFGLYARLDGTAQDDNRGAVIEGNKFFACEAHDNHRGGFSMDISANCGEGAVVRNNFIQGAFYDNRMSGVLFRNKQDNAIFENNEVDILVFGNQSLRSDGSGSSIGGGLSVDGSPISGITGAIVGYDNGYGNGGRDVNLNKARDCSLTIYTPNDQNPAHVNGGDSSNDVDAVGFTCSDSFESWAPRAYCSSDYLP